MPMTADEVCRALIHEADRMEGFYAEEEAAIREAFAIADRAREELERLEAEHPVPLQQLGDPAHALIVMLRRILGEEGSA